ncbi:MAG: hypothetical protein ACTS73_05535 [Arsenophonus sp. NEOnobi-MAG3]
MLRQGVECRLVDGRHSSSVTVIPHSELYIDCYRGMLRLKCIRSGIAAVILRSSMGGFFLLKSTWVSLSIISRLKQQSLKYHRHYCL